MLIRELKGIPVITAEGRMFAVYNDKKENKIYLIYKEIQSGAVAKSYMRKGFLL